MSIPGAPVIPGLDDDDDVGFDSKNTQGNVRKWINLILIFNLSSVIFVIYLIII